MVVAAGQMLSTGDPVLTILDRYSFNELTDIMNAMEERGREGWRFPPVDHCQCAERPVVRKDGDDGLFIDVAKPSPSGI
jgi:hypothetical protein